MAGDHPLIVDVNNWSELNGSNLVLDPFHHKITLNTNDVLASISFAISARSFAEEGYIDAQVHTDVHLLPEVAASLTADVLISFSSDVSLNVPEATVSTTPTDANAAITVEGTAAGAQLTTAGHVELYLVTLDGRSHHYDVDFQGDKGILDFEFAAANGTSDTFLVWAADSLKLHTESSIMFA
jgi:hypothetical protein